MGGLKARFRLPVESCGWTKELVELCVGIDEALDFIESNALTASSSLSPLLAGGWLGLPVQIDSKPGLPGLAFILVMTGGSGGDVLLATLEVSSFGLRIVKGELSEEADLFLPSRLES